MSERIAVIFGATGGVGSALARRLGKNGWQLVLAGRNGEKLEALAGEVGGKPLIADATKPDEVDATISKTTSEAGAPTAVVNCVGSIIIKPAHLTKDEEWHETIDLNLNTSFYIVRAAAKSMRKGGGAIALCTTAAALIGISNHEAIAAAKGGVIGLTRAAAASYARSGIRVNAVAPGLVETEMARKITENDASRKFSLGMHPMGRLGTADDVASALAWLIDPEQSWVTGQVLGVEGGLSSLKDH